MKLKFLFKNCTTSSKVFAITIILIYFFDEKFDALSAIFSYDLIFAAWQVG
jgi:hypothetical protein